MCGRYTWFEDLEGLLRIYQLPVSIPSGYDYPRRYNIAPTQTAPIITANGIQLHRWGLIPRWTKDESIGNKMINARSETIASKPSFKNLLYSNRILVPTTGFYEWQKGENKRPYFISTRTREPFVFAGLASSWHHKETDRTIDTFTIITTETNSDIQDIHHRMPFILHPEEARNWLNPDEDENYIRDILRRAPSVDLQAYPVTTLVNSPRFDDKTLIKRLAPLK